MTQVNVSVGACEVTNDPDSILATYALGSCMAITIWDPVALVGGLLHLMLPESSLHRAKAEQNPFMFADTGIPRLFHRAYELGALKGRLVVWLAGGAQVMDQQGVFNIGKRNYLAARKILWKAGVLVQGEEVGESISRTVRLEVGTGRMWLRTAGEADRELNCSAGNFVGGNVCPSMS